MRIKFKDFLKESISSDLVSIGNFTVESGKVLVSDPCYEQRGGRYQGLFENVKKGKWNAYIIDSSAIEELVAINDYYEGEKLNWQDSNFEIGVDSAQAGIFDLKYYGLIDKEDYQEYFCTEHGCVSTSGEGDGIYRCLVARIPGERKYVEEDPYGEEEWNETNPVVAIKIIFIENDEDFNEEDLEREAEAGNWPIIGEQYEVDPYGEENWNTEYDLSGMEIDEKIEKLKELIIGKPTEFHYNRYYYTSDNDSGVSQVFGQMKHIPTDVMIAEDGEILIKIPVKSMDIWLELDTNHPIMVNDETNIIL